MTRTEIKIKINKIIDRLPDRSLEAIYEIFRKAEEKKGLNLESSMNKILKEDSDLLQRLAQ
jgi:hypothetical protein